MTDFVIIAILPLLVFPAFSRYIRQKPGCRLMRSRVSRQAEQDASNRCILLFAEEIKIDRYFLNGCENTFPPSSISETPENSV